jgi:hypothetical protein
MGIDVETKKCPYCDGEIKLNSLICDSCYMDLSNLKRNQNNELVKVCPSCSREYSFSTKVCSFCSKYLDNKKPVIPQQNSQMSVGFMLINALIIPGLGTMLAGKKMEALLLFAGYLIWLTLAAWIVLNVSNLFWIMIIPVELIIRSINLLPVFHLNTYE